MKQINSIGTSDFTAKSRIKKWVDITTSEMYVFMTLTFAMTRNKHSTIEAIFLEYEPHNLFPII